jgi:tetratricopeptide (TPR) repeat protein
MNEENRDPHAAEDLVNRYEKMLANNESYYFDIDQLEEIVDFYCDNNKFNLALTVIDYAYGLFPDNTTMMLRESQILAGMGQLSSALRCLKKLVHFEPRNQEAYLTMGSIYSQLREHKKAIDLFRKALEIGGDEFEEEIYLEIALEYENMERFDKAAETLQDALSRQPENETLLYELAYCYDVLEKNEESISFFKKFTDEHPFSFAAWYNLGNASQKAGKFQDALDAYDYCTAIQQDFSPAYYNKAHTLFKMDRFQEAIHCFEETYAYETPQAPVYCHIGECFEKLNELDKALFYYRKSIQTDEFYADAYVGMGVVYDLQGKTGESLSLIERAIELEPEHPDYHLFLVEMLVKLGRLDEAEALTEVLVARFPENEDVWLDHSDVLFDKGQIGAAISAINDGWQKLPQSVSLGYRKVAYLMASGQKNEAQELLFRMFMNDPSGMDELEEYFPEISQDLLFIELMQQRKNL